MQGGFTFSTVEFRSDSAMPDFKCKGGKDMCGGAPLALQFVHKSIRGGGYRASIPLEPERPGEGFKTRPAYEHQASVQSL